MPFTRYLKSHYTKACSRQSEIKKDPEIVRRLRDGSIQPELLNSWMRSYGLFQGIKTRDRKAIVDAFLEYAKTFKRHRRPLKPEIIEKQFTELLAILYKTVNRSWMSATSKLLWCLYPHDFVIYDAFVHRTLLVLQCLDSKLINFERIGTPPTIKSNQDINQAVKFYMNYQGMVKHLQKENQPTLDALRQRHNESYLYDIRIVDKLLWMIGDPSKKH